MQKTKLGISVGLLAAVMFVVGGFSGYITGALVAGYVLLFEENLWIKRMAVKMMALLCAFTLLGFVIGLIPDCISTINSVLYIFSDDTNISVDIITNICAALTRIVSLAKDVLFVLLAVKALKQTSIRIPVVDNIIGKHMD